MPTVLIQDGFRLFFYSNENDEPAHVHVEKGGAIGKWWLDPVQTAWVRGFTKAELRKADTIVRLNRARILEAWNEHFSD